MCVTTTARLIKGSVLSQPDTKKRSVKERRCVSAWQQSAGHSVHVRACVRVRVPVCVQREQ